MRCGLAVAFVILLGAHGAAAQDEPIACNALICSDGTPAFGEPGACECSPIEPTKPQPLSCEANFGCIDPSQVGFGEWPICGCMTLETPRPPPGGSLPDPAPDPGLGQLDTCEAFYECEPGWEMIIWNGRCVCGTELLPPPK